MKLVKVGTLQGPVLDWAVASVEAGLRVVAVRPPVEDFSPPTVGLETYVDSYTFDEYDPSTNWGWAGPIIEREGIDIYHVQREPNEWHAEIQTAPWQRARGKGATPLTAAMRAYVASKLGNEIEIPEELS